MPDPLPAESSRRTIFAECVQKCTNDIYMLSSMLLQQSAEAEKVTIRTFKELHKIFRQKASTASYSLSKLTALVSDNAPIITHAGLCLPRHCLGRNSL